MAATPAAVIADFLAHTSPDEVQEAADRLVAEDATWIALNFDNPELKRIMPWTGTSTGRQAFVDAFTKVRTWWEAEDFRVVDMFGSGEDLAVFGEFTYRSDAIGKNRPLAVRDPREGPRLGDRLLPVHGGHVRHGPLVQRRGHVADQERPRRPRDRSLKGPAMATCGTR